MKQTISAIAMLAVLIIATHTGKSTPFTTISGKAARHCQYQIPGRTFWVDFLGYTCPATINVD